MSLKGSCLCGAVHFESSADPAFSGKCYCADCRKESGTGHITIAAVPDATVTVTGPTAIFRKAGGSGHDIERTFCTQCGSTLFSRPKAMAGMTMLRAGTLDDCSAVNPHMNIYVSRATAWDPPNSSILGFPEMPPRS